MIVFLGVGSCLQASSQALSRDDPNKLLIIIIIVIDTKGAQALRAAGQPVVAGLVLRNAAPRAPRWQSLSWRREALARRPRAWPPYHFRDPAGGA